MKIDFNDLRKAAMHNANEQARILSYCLDDIDPFYKATLIEVTNTLLSNVFTIGACASEEGEVIENILGDHTPNFLNN